MSDGESHDRLAVSFELRRLPEMRCFSDSMILVTGLRWTEKVWKSCGPEPTVSGCWTMTLTVPELVP